jgi:diguanylate cyclase (GGDEF)-like protein/PAS domain S-box-containing protein
LSNNGAKIGAENRLIRYFAYLLNQKVSVQLYYDYEEYSSRNVLNVTNSHSIFSQPANVDGDMPENVRDAMMRLSMVEQNQRLTLAAQVGGLGVWDYDISRNIMTCDGQWYRIMGRDPSNPVVSVEQFRACIHPEDVDRATEVERAARQLLSERQDYGIVFRILRPNGEVRWVRSAACIFEDSKKTPVRAVGYVVDITESHLAELALKARHAALVEENQSLARQALIDPLTGIANRRRLDQEIIRACNHARGNGQSLAVVMIDVDHFKTYNDHYGHQLGDDALIKVAEAIASAAWRPYDLAARFGGEEFAVLLPGTVDPRTVIERIFSNVAALDLPHEKTVLGRLSVSCGCVYTAREEFLEPRLLLDQSDQRLYQAKQHGRNRFMIDKI